MTGFVDQGVCPNDRDRVTRSADCTRRSRSCSVMDRGSIPRISTNCSFGWTPNEFCRRWLPRVGSHRRFFALGCRESPRLVRTVTNFARNRSFRTILADFGDSCDRERGADAGHRARVWVEGLGAWVEGMDAGSCETNALTMLVRAFVRGLCLLIASIARVTRTYPGAARGSRVGLA